MEIEPKTATFGSLAPGLGDTELAAKVDARHHEWSEQLPEAPGDLWDALGELDAEQQQALFAHCVSLTVNAVNEAYNGDHEEVWGGRLTASLSEGSMEQSAA